MIRSIIRFSVENRFFVILSSLLLLGLGVLSMQRMSLDAIPDLSDTQVIVYSTWNQSPDLVENQVTFPIVSGLMGLAKVKSIRGSSDFGASFVYVIFEDGTDLYWARSRVLETLSQITATLPEDVETQLGPDATSVGWVYQYTLVDELKKHSLADLRSYQDWTLKFHLQSVEGVAEVASLGGFEKEYQIQVNPYKLQNYHLTFADVMKAVSNSNDESGGRVMEISNADYMIRSRALVSGTEDLENAVVDYNSLSKTPILLKDVASVSLGPAMRRGVGDFNGRGDAVSGIVVMRQGANALKVIEGVKEKLAEVKSSLPEGVTVEAVYDRSTLIEKAISNLKKTLTKELIIVSLVILIFLWHFPSAFVPIITIPVAVILSFIPLFLTGQTTNIMSLAGIAISIGVLVDGAIIEVENAYRKIQHWHEDGKKEDFKKVRLDALLEVGPSVFFSLLIIAVAFLPVFTLVDQEGRLFKPLAYSKNFAMAIAAILAVTLDPAVRMLFSRAEPFQHGWRWLRGLGNTLFVGKYYSEHKHPVSKQIFKIYEPCVHWVLEHRKTTLVLAAMATLSIIPAYSRLGSEFMPQLNEGSLLYMPTALPGLSIAEAGRLITIQDSIIKSFPEVESVYGKAGRADTSTDTAPISMVETTIVLKDHEQWREKETWYGKRKITQGELVDEMNSALDFKGMPNIWTMPIKNRIDMLSTGIRSAVGVKVYGPDLAELQKVAASVESLMKTYPGTRSVVAERANSGRYLDIDLDRRKLASYGLTVKDVHLQAMRATGGVKASEYLAGRERYDIQLRLGREFRDSVEAIENLPLQTKSGAMLRLRDIAKIKYLEGPAMIRSENALPVSYVFIDFDTDAIDVGTYVDGAKEYLQQHLSLSPGYSIAWAGQYENMLRVEERMKIVIPITLLLILLILFMSTKSWVKSGIVLMAVPFSLVGAFWFLNILDYNMSIATWVGMIALMGLDAETGVFMLLYLDMSYDEKSKKGQMNSVKDLYAAIIEGAVHRVRPKMMTVLSLLVGLMPIMWAVGSGSEVMKRIAAPMIGGLTTSFLLELLIYPVFYYEWRKRQLRAL